MNMSFKVAPYHRLGVQKWAKLNIKYQLEDLAEATHEDVEMFNVKLKLKPQPLIRH